MLSQCPPQAKKYVQSDMSDNKGRRRREGEKERSES